MKQTNYNSTQNEMVVITFNQPAQDGKYTPAVVEVRCDAITEEGAIRGITRRVEVGNPADTKLSLKQIYNQVNKATTGGIIAGVIKQAFIEAVNTDPSV